MPDEPTWLAVALDNQPRLWILAVLLYGVGDTVTTIVGLQQEGIAEIGPIALVAIEHIGIAGLLLLKVGFFAICFGVWYALSTPGRVAIPSALAVAGAAVTGWNLSVILV